MHATGFKAVSPLEVGDIVIMRSCIRPSKVTDIQFIISSAKNTIDVYYCIEMCDTGWVSTFSLDYIECRIDEHGNRIPLHDETSLYTEIWTQ